MVSGDWSRSSSKGISEIFGDGKDQLEGCNKFKPGRWDSGARQSVVQGKFLVLWSCHSMVAVTQNSYLSLSEGRKKNPPSFLLGVINPPGTHVMLPGIFKTK